MKNSTHAELAELAFRAAIHKAGGQGPLAMALGSSQTRMSRIVQGESQLEAEMAARIDRLYRIPKYDLRPDLFDPPKGCDPVNKRMAAYQALTGVAIPRGKAKPRRKAA
jgi:DNA-binding transcriptional regulator YdaS (Cro superfamily)